MDTIGSEVAIGDEHFYIINSTSTKLTLLSKYNLLVGSNYYANSQTCNKAGYNMSGYYCVPEYDTFDNTTVGYGLQSENAKGFECSQYEISDAEGDTVATYTSDSKISKFNSFTEDEKNDIAFISCAYKSYYIHQYIVPFSDSNYWSASSVYPKWVYNDNATIKTYVDNYEKLIEDNYSISISKARLINESELTALGCNVTSYTCVTNDVLSNNYIWLFDTTYWTGFAYDTSKVYAVQSTGDIAKRDYNANGYYGRGVRPVLEILK